MSTLYGTPVKVSAQRRPVMLRAEIEDAREALETFPPESLEAARKPSAVSSLPVMLRYLPGAK